MNTNEKYLKRVWNSLLFLPAARRKEEIAELQVHLAGLAAAADSKGLTESETYTAAISQLGPPADLGSRLSLAYWRGRCRQMIYTPFGMTLLSAMALGLPEFLNNNVARHEHPSPNVMVVYLIVPPLAAYCWYLLIAAAAGYFSARRAAIAIPAAGFLCSLFGFLIPQLNNAGLSKFLFLGLGGLSMSYEDQRFYQFAPQLLGQFGQLCLHWALIGLGGVLLGFLLRKANNYYSPNDKGQAYA